MLSQIIYLRRLLKLTVTPATVFHETLANPTSFNFYCWIIAFVSHEMAFLCKFILNVSVSDPSLIELTQINTKYVSKCCKPLLRMISHFAPKLTTKKTKKKEKKNSKIPVKFMIRFISGHLLISGSTCSSGRM